MKLNALLETRTDSQRQAKANALMLQQALADDWDCNLEAPKPIDQDTGEVFPWIINATNVHDGNKVKFEASCTHIAGLGRNYHTFKPVTSEGLQEEISKLYKHLIDEVVADLVFEFSDELTSRNVNLQLKNFDSDEDTFNHLKKTYLEPCIKKWMANYDSQSLGLVNSELLAKQIANRVTDEFETLFDEAILE